MMFERTGHEVAEQHLLSVLEEPRHEVLALRFVFATALHGVSSGPVNTDFAQVRWFSRLAARGMLEERDAVPTLGVMSLIRGWADGVALRPHELLLEDAFCPCGSGFRYPGCCGWDKR